jgi:class 3 adenylate cyclase/tetratricopeptide (TPR) repeat protein
VIHCPSCQHENPPTARFCNSCGAAFEATCPSCQHSNPAGSRFCNGCGTSLSAAPTPTGPPFTSPQAYTPKHLAEKILTSKAALEGERKQVTVLFVDAAGFTSLSERLDPEDVHALMTRAFDLMLAEVHRYEGTVNQFLGDGLMALFGAPIAHEDHAVRAVHAALGINRALVVLQDELRPRGITFRVRQALNTGLVVVGSIGNDLRMDYTAVGDTTNVAARLQQAAEPGQIILSASTCQLVTGYFELRELGALQLKGKAEAVAAWQVLAARESRTRLEVDADVGLTPFVGREREMTLMLEAFHKAETGAGQVVFVIGEAGIGKSRLLHEFRRRVGERATWLEGHCMSFGRAMAFHPLVDMLRRIFRIDESDGDAAIAEKIERGVTRVGDDLRPIVPYLRALLSVDPGDDAIRSMVPQERRGETFEALKRLLARAAEQRPQILLVEDLHWVDAATEQFLMTLVDSVPALRVVLVCTYRPGYANPFGDRTYYSRITPESMSSVDSASIAATMLGVSELPDELSRLIASKTEGNPFYVEELIKALEESGALRRTGDRYELVRSPAELLVPSTIQALIAARIDRLDEGPKRTLQIASVIGREFTQRLVHRLSELRERTDTLLQELKALELIRERRLLPELAYMFKHALTQDVAYNSLLLQRRKTLHGAIGAAIEELYADRLAEHYEVLAHHFVRAEQWERALTYLVKAAEKATQAYALREALDLYAEALSMATRLGEPPDTVVAVRRARSDLLYAIGDFSGAADEARELVEFTRRHQLAAEEAAALVQQAWSTAWMEEFPPALTLAADAVRVGEQANAQVAVAGALQVRGFIHALTARHEEATSDLTRCLTLLRGTGNVGTQSMALYVLSNMDIWVGAYQRGLELATEGVGLSRERRLVAPLLRCLWTQSVSRIGMGDYQAALEGLREALTLCEKIGDPGFQARFLNTLGWLHVECGDFEGGLALSDQGLALARASRHATGIERVAFTLINEADAFIARGDLVAGAGALDEAYHIVRNPPSSRWMTWRYSIHCYVSLGELALQRGDPAEASSFADQSLAIAVPTRSRKYESRAWRLRGEAATARRAWDEAEDCLQRARQIADAIAEPRSRWHALAALGRYALARGRTDEAHHAYAAASEIVEPTVTKVSDPGLRSGLGCSPVVQEIRSQVAP